MRDLSLLKDRHKNKPAFILGSGCSLTKLAKPSILKQGIVFSCNESIIAIDKANYFVCVDSKVADYKYFEKAVNVSDNIVFCSGEYIYDEYFLTTHKNKFLFMQRYSDRNNKSFDISDNLLIYGQSVTMVACHLAYICGCSPIILMGVDLRNDKGKRYFSNECRVLKDGTENKADYSNELLRNFAVEFKKIKEQNPKAKIYNAGFNDWVIPVFEYIDIFKYFK